MPPTALPHPTALPSRKLVPACLFLTWFKTREKQTLQPCRFLGLGFCSGCKVPAFGLLHWGFLAWGKELCLVWSQKVQQSLMPKQEKLLACYISQLGPPGQECLWCPVIHQQWNGRKMQQQKWCWQREKVYRETAGITWCLKESTSTAVH